MTISALEDVEKKKEKPIWDPHHFYRALSPMTSPSGIFVKRRKCHIDPRLTFGDVDLLSCWSLENISKAGKLLQKPPVLVQFNDENEMRKIYSMIYDVFRYKHVLSQALADVGFFEFHPQLRPDQNRVWLMLFDYYVRSFEKRPPEVLELQHQLFKDADLILIYECLWEHRIRLAASVSRLRIKNGALHLSQLLPIHLQDEKVAIAAANPIVTGWMNPFKMKDKTLAIAFLKNMGMTEAPETEGGDEKPLQLNQYKWDKVCPLFMSCMPTDRSHFAQSDLVKNNYFVLQDRTFSLGPAILSRLSDHFELDGDVVQTHVSSPRSTAYLAALFYSVNRVNDFIAFGAGKSLPEYKEYIKMLGVNNIRLYAENFCKISLEAQILESVVGIFATPPNSFSGVADPIDLICSRGGDLSMLAVLTESEISSDGKCRVAQLLEEQRETLRLAMSRPQVQFVLYETHSIVGSENKDMVERAVEDINRCSFEKHLLIYKEKKRLEALAELELANIPAAAMAQTSSPRRKAAGGSAAAPVSSAATNKSDEPSVKIRKSRRTSAGSQSDSDVSNLDTGRKSGEADSDDLSHHVKVPKTDEFLVTSAPDICMNQDKCINFQALGCFISLVHRKQVTQLNAKYLIKMAEARGLFGNADRSKNAKPKSSKRPERKAKNRDLDDMKKSRTKKGDIGALIERLNQPTHASTNRSHLRKISSAESKILKFDFVKKSCSRHSKHHSDDLYLYSTTSPYMASLHLDSRAKRWWQETTNYVNRVRLLQREYANDKKTACSLHDIREQMGPLRLPKAPYELYTIKSESRIKTQLNDRSPYPVSVHKLEFKGYGMLPEKFGDGSGYWTT